MYVPKAQSSFPPPPGNPTAYQPRRDIPGFDRDIFTGSPSLKHLLDTYSAKLTTEEKAFLDNETDALCKLLDDHQVLLHPPRSTRPAAPAPQHRSTRRPQARAPHVRPPGV